MVLIRRRTICLGGVALVAAVAATGPGAARAQEATFFRIGTGSTAGTYFPVGSMIASAISNPPGSESCDQGGSCGVPNVIALAVSTQGSVANVLGVADGGLQSGLAQSDIVTWAYTGTGLFAKRGAYTNLRVIANLYPESVHLVARRGAGIRTVADLKGKRVSLDRAGSGTNVNARAILAGYGLAVADVAAVEASPEAAIGLLEAGDLDAFFFVAGYPAAAVQELAEVGAIDLIPITGPAADGLRAKYPFFAPDMIPAGTYPGIPEVRTLSVGAQWIVSAEANERLIYQITQALWNPATRTILDSGHVKGRQIRRERALDGVSIPLHPGAKAYYREVGLIP